MSHCARAIFGYGVELAKPIKIYGALPWTVLSCSKLIPDTLKSLSNAKSIEALEHPEKSGDRADSVTLQGGHVERVVTE